MSANSQTTSGRVESGLCDHPNAMADREAVAVLEKKIAAMVSVSRLPAENPAPVIRLTKDGRFHYANPKAQEFLEEWDATLGTEAPPALRELTVHPIRRDAEILLRGRWYAVAVVPVEGGELINLYFSDVTERKQAEEALARSEYDLAMQLEDLQRLHECSRRLSGEKDLDTVFAEVLRATLQVHGTDRGLLSMYDDGQEILTVVASKGFSDQFIEMVQQVPLGAGACGNCFKDKQRIIVEDTETDPIFAPYREAARFGGFRAVHSTPLATRDAKIIGVLSVHFAHPRRPSQREIRLMDLYARQVADVLDDARLREEASRELMERIRAEKAMRERGERLELLSEMLAQLLRAGEADVVVRELFPKVAAHLGVDTYFNFMVVAGGGALELHSCGGISPETARRIQRLEFGQAICGMVAQTRTAIHATNIQESDDPQAALVRGLGLQCYACNPLIVGDRLLGTLSFASRTRPAFEEDELQFLRIISQHAAVALDRLQKAQQLRESEEKLEQIVAERTASLREAISQMEEFSYTVSHDLRAPLRGMQVYTAALLEDFAPALPADACHYLHRIAANASRLDKMIVDVLTFSRVARAELRLEPVNVERLVHQIVEQYPGMRPPDARIEIKPLDLVHGHEPSLTQALSNLLNNAVKFVAPNVTPQIVVWSERRDEMVSISVQDNGVGVNPKYQHRLFNLFERVHPELKYEGTGVGLAIVRKAVERMGGKVGMESDGVNGSRFWIELRAANSS